jgi:hypothetical protein
MATGDLFRERWIKPASDADRLDAGRNTRHVLVCSSHGADRRRWGVVRNRHDWDLRIAKSFHAFQGESFGTDRERLYLRHILRPLRNARTVWISP